MNGCMITVCGYFEDCLATSACMSVAKKHSATCRKCGEEEMGKTERGQKAKAKADERWVDWTANHIE